MKKNLGWFLWDNFRRFDWFYEDRFLSVRFLRRMAVLFSYMWMGFARRGRLAGLVTFGSAFCEVVREFAAFRGK